MHAGCFKDPDSQLIWKNLMYYVYSLAQLLDQNLQLKDSTEPKSDVFSDSNSINFESNETN